MKNDKPISLTGGRRTQDIRDKTKNLDLLWAPWRVGYITALQKESGCFLCRALKAKGKEADKKHLVLHRGKTAFVILNLYPYNNGHLLIVPRRHTSDIETLKQNEQAELFSLLIKSTGILRNAMNAQGFNAGINLGKAGGAGLDTHIHFHLVPRWKGDNNFMPVTCHTKVISQSLEETYKLLKKEFERLKKCT